MESMPMFKQMLDANKTLIDSTFSAMVKGQEQVEAVMNTMLDSTTRVSKEAKATMDQWAKVGKNGCDNWKSVVDTGFETVQKLFSL